MALTDAGGQVVDRYHYDVWGVPTIDLERVPQPLLYAGYVYDREFHGPGEASGWYWLSVRHYDPALGRFLQPDPSEQEGTRSYAYAGDDPLDATDPSGLGPFGTCVPYFESCRLPTGDEARRVGYGVANEAAGGLDVVSFGAFSHVAGAVGAKVDTNSLDYLAGSLITGVALTALSLGADPAADAVVAVDSANLARNAETAANDARAAENGEGFVYRGLAKGEDTSTGIRARAPDAGNSITSHVAGQRASQWISTTKSIEIAQQRFGQFGVVRIDLSQVGSKVVDLSQGIPGMPSNYMLSRWARNVQEVLIQGYVPPEAFQLIEG